MKSDVACESFIYLREELVVSLVKPHHCLRASACAEEGAGGLRSYCWCVSLLVLHSTSRAATHLHTLAHKHKQAHKQAPGSCTPAQRRGLAEGSLVCWTFLTCVVSPLPAGRRGRVDAAQVLPNTRRLYRQSLLPSHCRLYGLFFLPVT